MGGDELDLEGGLGQWGSLGVGGCDLLGLGAAADGVCSRRGARLECVKDGR